MLRLHLLRDARKGLLVEKGEKHSVFNPEISSEIKRFRAATTPE
jgi:hypothetical protein